MLIKNHLNAGVVTTVEETLNALLDAEADQLGNVRIGGCCRKARDRSADGVIQSNRRHTVL